MCHEKETHFNNGRGDSRTRRVIPIAKPNPIASRKKVNCSGTVLDLSFECQATENTACYTEIEDGTITVCTGTFVVTNP